MKLAHSISRRLFLNKNGYVFVIKIVTLSVEPEILAGFFTVKKLKRIIIEIQDC